MLQPYYPQNSCRDHLQQLWPQKIYFTAKFQLAKSRLGLYLSNKLTSSPTPQHLCFNYHFIYSYTPLTHNNNWHLHITCLELTIDFFRINKQFGTVSPEFLQSYTEYTIKYYTLLGYQACIDSSYFKFINNLTNLIEHFSKLQY